MASIDYTVPLLSCMLIAAVVGAQKPAAGDRPRYVHHRVVAGDFDGDGRTEAALWDSDSKLLSVVSFKAGKRQQLATHALADFPTAMRARDLDGDGRDELVIGQGLRGYNKKDEPAVDIRVCIHRPLGPKGWTTELVFQKASARPSVTALQVTDVDGDRRPELVFSCFVSKYFNELHVARRHEDGWSAASRGKVRMGMQVAAGIGGALIVGRPYGDKLGDLGDAFLLVGAARTALPAFRGVSAVAAGDVDGDSIPEVLVGDGWHQNYGRLARARLTVIHREENAWHATPVEDLPAHIRFVDIEVLDLDGDGRGEVLARAARPRSLGGDVRLYQLTPKGWRGRTLATDVQGCAIGRFTGGGLLEVMAAGAEPTPRPLRLDAGWDAHLTAPEDSVDVDAEALIGKPAPPLHIETWLGGSPCTLADLQGKVVLLDFWATWCKPCIAGFPTLERWRKRFGSDRLVVLGITHHDGQTEDRIATFRRERKLPWRVAVDPRKRPHQAYGVGPIPHLVVIDRRGVVRLTHVGAKGLEDVERLIEKLLDDR